MNLVNPYRFGSSGSPLAGNIISYYNFNNNVEDQVGLNDGIFASPNYANTSSGFIDYYADFSLSASPPPQVTITNDPSITFGDGVSDVPFSLSMALKNITSLTQIIISKRTNTNYEYILLQQSSALIWRLYDNVANQRINVTISSSDFPASDTFTLTITNDGTNTLTGKKAYVNGLLVSSTNTYTGSYTAMHSTGADLRIARNGPLSNYWKGEMDELYFFNKELSASEALICHDYRVAGNPLI